MLTYSEFEKNAEKETDLFSTELIKEFLNDKIKHNKLYFCYLVCDFDKFDHIRKYL